MLQPYYTRDDRKEGKGKEKEYLKERRKMGEKKRGGKDDP